MTLREIYEKETGEVAQEAVTSDVDGGDYLRFTDAYVEWLEGGIKELKHILNELQERAAPYIKNLLLI